MARRVHEQLALHLYLLKLLFQPPVLFHGEGGEVVEQVALVEELLLAATGGGPQLRPQPFPFPGRSCSQAPQKAKMRKQASLQDGK